MKEKSLLEEYFQILLQLCSCISKMENSPQRMTAQYHLRQLTNYPILASGRVETDPHPLSEQEFSEVEKVLSERTKVLLSLANLGSETILLKSKKG